MADAPQNFTDMFKNLGEQLKIPSFDMTKIMEHQQKNLEAMTKSWQAMAGGASEIANKQREIFEAAVKDVTAMVQEYKPGGSPQDIMAKQAEFAKKAMEAAIANTRDIAELVQKSTTEAFKIVQDRMKESYEEIRTTVEKKIAERPPGRSIFSAFKRAAGGPRSEDASPPPVRKHEALPAGAVELLPLAFGLGQPVGDGIDGGRMMAEPAMAAIDLDVLDLLALLVDAGLPGADAVGAAEDRGGRHRRRLGEGAGNVLVAILDTSGRRRIRRLSRRWSPWGCRRTDCPG